jgi:hypothetical protein
LQSPDRVFFYGLLLGTVKYPFLVNIRFLVMRKGEEEKN